MKGENATRSNHQKGGRTRGITSDERFLRSDRRRTGHEKRLKFTKPSTKLLVLILGLIIVLRLTIESSLVRNHLFSTRYEQTYRGSEGTGSFPKNQTLEMKPTTCKDSDECSQSNISLSSTKDPITICSGSSFQNVPSALNLLFPSQTQRQQHICYETSQGDVFRDKSNKGHNYSDANYVFHTLGGGTCNREGFESLPSDASNNIIVTAYYQIPSKHPPNKYHEWMGNFLSVYKDPIVIFTSPDMVELLANLRRRNESSELCDKPPCGPNFFDTIIVALPLEELPLARLYPKSFWVDQLDRDPQSHIHSPLRGDPRMQGEFESGELYWIWLSKIWFVVETTRILGVDITLKDDDDATPTRGKYSDKPSKQSKYDGSVFAWIDMGSFRNEDPIANTDKNPPFLIRHPEVVPTSEMLFWSHSSAHSSQSSDSNQKTGSNKNYTPIPPRQSPFFDDKSLGGGKYFFHSGAHFAGRPRSIHRFYYRFLKTIDTFVERNLTLADDQAVMQSSCLSFSYGQRCGELGCKKISDNLCRYATRDMVGGKSKWFGLTKLLQIGLKETSQRTRAVTISDNPHDLYWKPPPPTYYHDYKNQSSWIHPTCSSSI